VSLWDAVEATPRKLPPADGPRAVVTFTPDGKTVRAAGAGGVTRWDATSGAKGADSPLRDKQEDERFQGEGVALSADGRIVGVYFATGEGAAKRTVHFWDAETGKVQEGQMDCSALVGQPVFSPDGKTLAAGGSDHAIRLWDVVGRKNVLTLRGPSAPAVCLAFAPDGRTLAALHGDGSLHLWDVTPPSPPRP
jgi:WD40 repeat protein